MITTPYRYKVLVVLCSLAFLTYLDRICIMRVQGDIERDLGLTQLSPNDEATLRARGQENDANAREKLSRDRATQRMSWIFSAFVAGYVLFEVPGGWLGDRYGARRVIFRIVLCWSVLTAATGGVRGIASLITSNPGPLQWLGIMVAVRFLFGVGEAGAYPNIARSLGRWFPFRERASAQSFVWLASRLGGAVAPALIGFLIVAAGNWERAFWILGIAGVVWATGFFFWFRDRPEDQPLVDAAEREQIRGARGELGSIYDDDATSAPFAWTQLLSPNVLALCLVSFCVSFCFYFYITFLPKYLKEEFQFDYSKSEWITGLPLLAGGLSCLLGGFLSDFAIGRMGSKRWGRRMAPLVGWTAAGLCALTVSFLHSATAVVVLIVVAFAFQDLGVPSMWSLPADIGGRFAGTVGGWMNAAGAIGGMLSPLVAANVATSKGWNATFVVFGAVYLVGAAAWLRVDASQPIESG